MKNESKDILIDIRKMKIWNDPLTASFYATNILWNKPTDYSIKDTNQRFKNINIKLGR
jgi:hypothetical protein